MAEIVNLRRVRKAKARSEREDQAAENRARFGQSKPVRALTKARADQESGRLDSGKLEPKS